MGDDYTPVEVAELMRGGQVQLIDVREEHERQVGRIAGSLHIPLGQLPRRTVALARDQLLVIYCRSGARSAMAAEALRQAGYDAHNMVGGLLEWHAAGLGLDPPDGYVAD